MRVCYPGDWLEAPGILRNRLPIEALCDPRAADAAALRNLLQRQGYGDLDAVRDEGKAEGKTEGAIEALRTALLDVLEGRGLDIDAAARAQITQCSDADRLRAWLRRAATLDTAADLFNR